MKRLTTETLINKFIDKHGDTYDYSLVDYVNALTKVKIICKEHGIFEQRSTDHKNGSGCKRCGQIRTATAKIGSTRNDIKTPFTNDNLIARLLFVFN